MVADAIVLSHPEQRDRLAAAVPEALPYAEIGGDPCHDRIRASLPQRARYRRALGAGDRTRVVLVSSTWQRRSLFGSRPELLRRLLAELPADEYRVVAALHPNLRLAHGEFQVRSWLADCLRAGLTLLPAHEGWRASLVAADAVIGDHGAVTCYAATLDVPILLGSFPEDDVAPGSPVELLGELAPRLDPDRSLRSQLERATAEFRPGRYAGVATLVNAVPDESSRRLRALCYRLMNLPEPPTRALTHALPLDGLSGRAPVAALLVSGVCEGGQVALTRVPADVRLDPPAPRPDVPDAHLVVHAEHPDRALSTTADIVFCYRSELPVAASAWLAATLERYPGCRMAAVVESDGCLVRVRGSDALRLVMGDALLRASADPLAAASGLYLTMVDGGGVPPTIQLTVGGVRGSCRATPYQPL